jgi:hypothetical protein
MPRPGLSRPRFKASQVIFVVCLCAVQLQCAGTALAQIAFPRSDDPANTYDGRAAAIVKYYGCNDVGDFKNWLNEVSGGDYTDQGESLTAIVSSKINMWYGGNGCPSIPPDALRTQINSTLMLYKKHDQMGTTGLPCIPVIGATSAPFKGGSKALIISHGEYDVDMREIVRALYMGSKKGFSGAMALDESTRQHIVSDLLIAKGPPGPDDYSLIYDCGNREDSTGSAQDYADGQSWLGRAADSLDDALDYVLKRWLLLLALFFSGPLGGVVPGLTVPGIGPIPPVPVPPLVGAELVADPFSFSRDPESENHRLNIETTRYLANQEMLAELPADYPNRDVVSSQQGDTRDWLLHRLQQIAQQDFEEYNARPYGRYSLNAITNLYDFAADPAVKTAAQIILDFQTAKAVLGSNRARRYSPYRRKAENDGYDPDHPKARSLYNREDGADHETTRVLVLAGQTQLAENPASPQHYDPAKYGPEASPLDSNTELVNPALSSYRLPDPIQEIATAPTPLFQRIHNAGVEIYSAHPGFLITGGGIHTPPADHVYGVFGSESGVALPIVLIPTDGGLTLDDVIRIEGAGGAGTDRDDNACVADGFACGLNIQIPDFYQNCKDASSTDFLMFVNSIDCFGGIKNPFYLAIRQWSCPSVGGGGPGVPPSDKSRIACAIIEAADASHVEKDNRAAFEDFKASRQSALPSPDSFSPNKYNSFYHTYTHHDVFFSIPSNLSDSGGILSVDGVNVLAISDWPFADGDFISSKGDGFITVTGPISKKKLFLDFRSWNAPVWSKSY